MIEGANAPGKIRGKRIERARPCSLCGTFVGVRTFWAIPIEHGGLEIEWNMQSLCGPCEEYRIKKQQANMKGATDLSFGKTRKPKKQAPPFGWRARHFGERT